MKRIMLIWNFSSGATITIYEINASDEEAAMISPLMGRYWGTSLSDTQHDQLFEWLWKRIDHGGEWADCVVFREGNSSEDYGPPIGPVAVDMVIVTGQI